MAELHTALVEIVGDQLQTNDHEEEHDEGADEQDGGL